MKDSVETANQRGQKFSATFESFITEMMRQYGLRREEVLLGIRQFGTIRKRVRNYCRIAASLKAS